VSPNPRTSTPLGVTKRETRFFLPPDVEVLETSNIAVRHPLASRTSATGWVLALCDDNFIHDITLLDAVEYLKTVSQFFKTGVTIHHDPLTYFSLLFLNYK